MDTSNSGGVAAKNGFLYQDYAAAWYVVQMLQDKAILAVRCEVTDDIDIEYRGHEEHVQVKTKDEESKWSLGELCEVTKQKKLPGKPKPPPSTDSIIHKSIQCHKSASRPDTFRILSLRDVRKELLYLRSALSTRNDITKRDELIAAISKRISPYIGPGGTDITRWVNNTYWEVAPSLELIELRACNIIQKAAIERNIVLETGRDDDSILNSILVTLTKKSALSRAIFTADDKTYKREDFICWFEKEILALGENANIYKKVYHNNKASKSSIFVKFIEWHGSPPHKGEGISQGYRLGNYRYEFIADSIVNWLPELLLRPSELADNSSESFIRNINLIADRLTNEKSELKNLIGRTLMHSALRHYAESEPIPVSLYVQGTSSAVKEFENVHIVRAATGDELWLGFSELTNEKNLTSLLQQMAVKVNSLITFDFDKQRKRILEIKEDSYLSQHDIDDLTNIANSLDDNISRFRFVIFLGFKSDHFPVSGSAPTGQPYILESEQKFQDLLSALVAENSFFSELNFLVYLFPNPCVDLLQDSVEKKLREVKYV